jgi:hypothetical protein
LYFWIEVKKTFGGKKSFLKKFPENGKQIAKVFETIKLNKN